MPKINEQYKNNNKIEIIQYTIEEQIRLISGLYCQKEKQKQFKDIVLCNLKLIEPIEEKQIIFREKHYKESDYNVPFNVMVENLTIKEPIEILCDLLIEHTRIPITDKINKRMKKLLLLLEDINDLRLNGLISDNEYFKQCKIINDKPINKRENNTSGYRGVFLDKHRKNKYVAKISVNGKRIYLGYFNTALEASQAYEQAKIKYHSIED